MFTGKYRKFTAKYGMFTGKNGMFMVSMVCLLVRLKYLLERMECLLVCICSPYPGVPFSISIRMKFSNSLLSSLSLIFGNCL